MHSFVLRVQGVNNYDFQFEVIKSEKQFSDKDPWRIRPPYKYIVYSRWFSKRVNVSSFYQAVYFYRVTLFVSNEKPELKKRMTKYVPLACFIYRQNITCQ